MDANLAHWIRQFLTGVFRHLAVHKSTKIAAAKRKLKRHIKTIPQTLILRTHFKTFILCIRFRNRSFCVLLAKRSFCVLVFLKVLRCRDTIVIIAIRI